MKKLNWIMLVLLVLISTAVSADIIRELQIRIDSNNTITLYFTNDNLINGTASAGYNTSTPQTTSVGITFKNINAECVYNSTELCANIVNNISWAMNDLTHVFREYVNSTLNFTEYTNLRESKGRLEVYQERCLDDKRNITAKLTDCNDQIDNYKDIEDSLKTTRDDLGDCSREKGNLTGVVKKTKDSRIFWGIIALIVGAVGWHFWITRGRPQPPEAEQFEGSYAPPGEYRE